MKWLSWVGVWVGLAGCITPGGGTASRDTERTDAPADSSAAADTRAVDVDAASVVDTVTPGDSAAVDTSAPIDTAPPTDTAGPTDTSAGPVGAAIVVDGLLSDWDSGVVGVTDPAGDASGGLADLTRVALTSDADSLFIRLTFAAPLELDGGNDLVVYLDTDDDPATGWSSQGVGAELTWNLGGRNGYLNLGPSGQAVKHADLGFTALPTVSAADFELVLRRDVADRDGRPLFAGPRVALVIAESNGDRAPDAGALRVTLGDVVPARAPVDLSKAPGTFRVVTWNVLFDGIADPARVDAYERIIKALKPDILHLQEAKESAAAAQARLTEWLPLEAGQAWAYRRLSDRVTVSRYPFVTGWPGSYDPMHIRVALAAVQLTPDTRLVTFNAHLSCCDEDAARQAQIDSFIAYLEDLRTPAGSVEMAADTPFYLVGDFNTIGAAGPLTTALTGDIADEALFGPGSPPDWDGGPLVDPRPIQLGGNRATTWHKPTSGFWPSRIDFVLYPDSVLAAERAFILSTDLLTADELAAHGLHAGDSAQASDHVPVVVDMKLDQD